ncbi:hypothetical protein IMZ48_06265 [Candidatus Bathyarchaeota archaeon]|nr:hypothetical protein [Candidatus Bathyarchaeota archaeon]
MTEIQAFLAGFFLGGLTIFGGIFAGVRLALRAMGLETSILPRPAAPMEQETME